MKPLNSTSIAFMILSTLLTPSWLSTSFDKHLKQLNLQTKIHTFQSNEQLFKRYKDGEDFATKGAISAISYAIPLLFQKYKNPDKESFVPAALCGLSSILLLYLAHTNRQGQERAVQYCSTDLTEEEIAVVKDTLAFDSTDFLRKVQRIQFHRKQMIDLCTLLAQPIKIKRI